MKISDSILDYFSKYIYEQIGIVYNKVNYYQLESRLEKAMSEFSIETPEELQKQVSAFRNGDVIGYILDIATNNETSFLRDPKVFKAVIDHVLKPLAQKNAGKKLRIWSAACSTGQEPYSLAMELENIRTLVPDLDFEISATDFSKRVLEKASKGNYTQLEVQRGLSSLNLVKYFKQEEQTDPTGPTWSISDKLKSKIKFSHFNLLEPWNLHYKYDLIMCRNVLIYQNPEQKKEILRKMNQYLTPEGFLVLGCAEAITGLDDLYEPVQFDSARFFKNRSHTAKKAS